MKQIYILIIFILTFISNSMIAQSCIDPVFADASSPPGTTSVNLGCGGGTANMTATFNGQGTVSTNLYDISTIPFNFVSFTGTTIPIATDDIWSSTINLPFDFCFFGSTYNRLLVGSNGIVSFDVSTAGGTCPWPLTAPIPSTSYPRASIMGVYNDIDPRFGSTTRRIQYTTLGTAPCRQFIVSFEGIAYYSSSCPGIYANYQILLNETSNIVEVHIQDHNGCSSTNSGRGIIGIQDFNRTNAYFPAGRNAVTFATSNESWSFTPVDTSNSFRRMIVHLFENGTLVDSTVPYYSPFPTLRADFMRTISFPPDSHIFHIELVVYDSLGSSLCTVPISNYDFNDLLYYSNGSLRISATTSDITCYGNHDGAINITATSTSPPITYAWSDGPSSEDRTGLAAGTYTLTASDAGGCVQVRSYTIYEPMPLMVLPNLRQDVTCFGGNDGIIDVQIIGGTMPYTPLWSTGFVSEDIYGLNAGIYCLTVTDTNGCVTDYCDTILDGIIDSSSEVVNICAGDFVLINGILRGTTGNYADTFSSVFGCDSIHTINLIVGSRVFATINPRICAGDTFTVLGRNYMSTGVYYDTTISITGCDSVLTINLVVNNPTSFTLNRQLCTGDILHIGTHTYSASGTYYDTLINSNGCDSFITTNLIINTPTYNLIDTALCFGETLTVGTHHYSNTGTYSDTLNNSNGCDSIITTNLLIHPQGNTTDSFVICAGQSILGYTPTEDTIISAHLTNIYGCDSTYNIFINIQEIPKIDLGADRNIYVGDTVILSAVSGFSYNWSNGSTTNPTIVSPSTTTTYGVTVTDSIGCMDSATVIVNVFPLTSIIGFPSAFTPNGDGLNDYYYPILPAGSTLTTMVIYNRWGGVVYSGTSSPGWDGTVSGSPAPIGNYVYYINVTLPDPLNPLLTITQTYTGTISLIR